MAIVAFITSAPLLAIEIAEGAVVWPTLVVAGIWIAERLAQRAPAR
jgi:hypothetical protein